MHLDAQPETGSSRRMGVATPLMVAFLLRAIWAVAVPVEPVSDSNAYDTFARNLHRHGVYGWQADEPSAYWPVGTSAVYATVYAMHGPRYAGIVLLNLCLGLYLTWAIYQITCRLLPGGAGWCAAILYAVWPAQIQFTTILASELLYEAATATALLCVPTRGGWNVGRSTALGVVSAAGAYVRPTALLFPLLCLLGPLRGLPQRLLALAISSAVLAVLIAPWCWRNSMLFGVPTLLSTNGGANLWMGNNPTESLGYTPLPKELTEGLNEAERDKQLKRIAVEHIKANPLAFARRFTLRVVHLHDRESIGVAWNEPALTTRYGAGVLMPLKLVSTLFWYAILILSAAGIVLALRYDVRMLIASPVLVGLLYHVVVQAIIVSGDRYHMSEVPFLAPYAGLALSSLLSSFRASAPRVPDADSTA